MCRSLGLKDVEMNNVEYTTFNGWIIEIMSTKQKYEIITRIFFLI
jgi:hypothetical protein